ncbi:MAG TPA: hypothetical protein VGD80_15145 [Kofleriaceae bacterium]
MMRQIAVDEDVLLDLLAHLVAARRQIAAVDEQTAVLPAAAAALNICRVGRVIAGLAGRSSAVFDEAPMRRAPLEPNTHQVLIVSRRPGRPVEYLEETPAIDELHLEETPAIDELSDESTGDVIASCSEVSS